MTFPKREFSSKRDDVGPSDVRGISELLVMSPLHFLGFHRVPRRSISVSLKVTSLQSSSHRKRHFPDKLEKIIDAHETNFLHEETRYGRTISLCHGC